MFKAWLLNIEATDGPMFGTIVADPEDPTTLHLVAIALNADLVRRSPLIASVEALSLEARRRSALKYEFSQEIGAAMLATFNAVNVRDQEGAAPATVRTIWTKALERYQLAQAAFDATECGSPVADQMVERSCDAMDDLIARTRAPDVQAIALKVALAVNRADAFECIIFDEHLHGIIADVQRLSAMDLDPHPELLADHARRIDAIESIPLAEWSDDRSDREMAKVGDVSGTVHSAAIFDRVCRSISRDTDHYLRDDTIAELYLAVLQGQLRESRIESMARVFLSRAYGQWQSAFGPRSLDETFGADSARTLGETVADDTAAAQIEQMEIGS